jgi:hypothetical protein
MKDKDGNRIKFLPWFREVMPGYIQKPFLEIIEMVKAEENHQWKTIEEEEAGVDRIKDIYLLGLEKVREILEGKVRRVYLLACTREDQGDFGRESKESGDNLNNMKESDDIEEIIFS